MEKQHETPSRYDDERPTQGSLPRGYQPPGDVENPTLGQYAPLFDYNQAQQVPPPSDQPLAPVPPPSVSSWLNSGPVPTVQPPGPDQQSTMPMQPVRQQTPTPYPAPDPRMMPVQPPPPAVPQKPRKPVRRRRSRLNVLMMGCALGLVSTVGLMLCAGSIAFIVIWNSVNDVLNERMSKILQDQAKGTFQTTRIYDRYGNSLYEVLGGDGRRTQIRLANVAKYAIDATIAVEDATFYDNPGVDLAAIARAGLNYFTGNEAGGASTITQQLVRNIAFDAKYRIERSAQRKAEEILMAMALTRLKTKDEILEMYLNLIPYGNFAYGIEAAAQTYFGKSARDLTLAEAALLAGLPQAPSVYDPLNPDPRVQDTVEKRKRTVLDLMVERGKITRTEADTAANQPLNYANPEFNLRSPHFTVFAQDELKVLLERINLPESYLRTGGLSVYTTIDPDIQALVERTAQTQIALIKQQHNANNAAVVVLKPTTGEILAMMGSVNYKDDAIDGRVNVATAPRQPGSAMKPLTYAAALEKGYSAAHVLWDVEIHIGQPGSDYYSPVNYDRRFHGPVRMREALANSYNIPAVSMLRQIGVDTLLEFAERFGIRSLGRDASKYGLSLTLGGGEVTPLELAQAYAILANEGKQVSATSILCVVNGEGTIVYQYDNGCQGRTTANAVEATINATVTTKTVVDPRIAFVISDILADNRARSAAMGTNSPLRTEGITSSVKTGTTNNYRDNWTVGYTRNVVVGVWVGNTDNAEMKNTTGLTGAAPIWNGVITGIYNNPRLLEALRRNGQLRDDVLSVPEGLPMQKIQICNLAALTEPAANCAPARQEWILASPPLVPDGAGGMKPSQDPRFVPTRASTNGPAYADIDPGVTQTLVARLDPGLAMQIAAGITLYRNQPAPAPLYCLVPSEVRDQVAGATPQVFIKGPQFQDEYQYAALYAQANNLAILPRTPCSTEMLMSIPSGGGASGFISSPQPGESVVGTVYVSGTVNWGPGAAQFYKLEIQGPQFPNWTTFSGPTYSPVINGMLGNFGAGGLTPGTYYIRIVVVGNDSQHMYESPPVALNISGQ